jgi:sulfur-carrier protein
MIKLLFFAQLREKLECSQLDYPLTVAMTITDLKKLLASKGGQWRQVFTDQQVLTAVNQIMGNDDSLVADGDEVAFFPPVTGG